MISIVIPTQRRAGPLALAMRSAFAQTGLAGEAVELVVVDNDRIPTARTLVQTLAGQAPFPVRYIHEPRAGVANARNAGVSAATGEFIAFLDDDEEASPGWLAALLAAQRRFAADVVFGPVRARLPASVTRHQAYLTGFFSRVGPAETTVLDRYYGCGDSLVRRAALPDAAHPFSNRADRTGGEDDILFTEMQRAGARFAWAPDAWVWEDPAPERLNLSYALRRAFVYGQGAPHRCAAASPPDWAGVAGWMAVGAAQALAFGAAAGVSWLAHDPRSAFAFDRAARGLGKVFWTGPFRIYFYGQSAPATSRGLA